MFIVHSALVSSDATSRNPSGLFLFGTHRDRKPRASICPLGKDYATSLVHIAGGIAIVSPMSS